MRWKKLNERRIYNLLLSSRILVVTNMLPNWTQMESFHNFQATKEFKGSNGEETHATLVITNNIFTTLVLEQKLSNYWQQYFSQWYQNKNYLFVNIEKGCLENTKGQR